MKRLINFFHNEARRLMNLRDTPHAVAGGAAIGMFVGFTPLLGVKNILSLVLAYFFRCSKLAAVITVNLHDIVLPFMPVLILLEYQIGYFICSSSHTWPKKIVATDLHFADMMQWTTFLEIGRPLLVGSLLVSGPAALLTYAVLLPILRRREARRLLRESQEKSSDTDFPLV